MADNEPVKKKKGYTRAEVAPKEETLRHKEAFEVYYAMGDGRSLKLLGEVIGVRTQTLEIWSSVFGWQDRVAVRDKELIRRIQEDFAEESLKFRCFYIDLVKEMISSCIEIDDEGRKTMSIKPTSVSDLEKLIKLHMQLMGDPGTQDSGPGNGSGGTGNVTIVLPQQLDQGKWSEMVRGGPSAAAPITIPAAPE